MYLLLITNHYQIVEGILLSVGKGTIRVALRGFADTLELHQIGGGRWMNYPMGKTFEIAGLTVDPEIAPVGLEQAMEPSARAMAAGGGYAEAWN